MTDATARFSLPHILPGQAQKEMFHNEALALLDGALHAAAESRGIDVPPADPVPGQCWIVGDSPSGDWAGRSAALALWSSGGWRFIVPVEGMRVWLKDLGLASRWDGSAWVDGELVGGVVRLAGDQVVGPREPAIGDPSGGGTVDSEARSTITLILNALRAHGLIAN